MNKFDWLEQPPNAHITTMLVDEEGKWGNWARTTDIEKINYNRALLGVDFELTIGIKTALTPAAGITAVVSIGQFITIIGISRDEQSGFMHFFDYKQSPPVETLRSMLVAEYSERIADAFLRLQIDLQNGFEPFLFQVQLLRL